MLRVGPRVEDRLDPAAPETLAAAAPLLEAMRRAYAHPSAQLDATKPYLDPALRELMRDKGYW